MNLYTQEEQSIKQQYEQEISGIWHRLRDGQITLSECDSMMQEVQAKIATFEKQVGQMFVDERHGDTEQIIHDVIEGVNNDLRVLNSQDIQTDLTSGDSDMPNRESYLKWLNDFENEQLRGIYACLDTDTVQEIQYSITSLINNTVQELTPYVPSDAIRILNHEYFDSSFRNSNDFATKKEITVSRAGTEDNQSFTAYWQLVHCEASDDDTELINQAFNEAISANLQPIHKEVADSMVALFDKKMTYWSLEQLWDQMTGDRVRSSNDLLRLRRWVYDLVNTWVNTDILEKFGITLVDSEGNETLSMKRRYRRLFDLAPALLQDNRTGKLCWGFEFVADPIFYILADKQKQYTTIPIDRLRIPDETGKKRLKNTETKIVLTGYINDEVSQMLNSRSHRRANPCINIQNLYDLAGATTKRTTQTVRNICNNILDHLVEEKVIKGYEYYYEKQNPVGGGKTIKGYRISLYKHKKNKSK